MKRYLVCIIVGVLVNAMPACKKPAIGSFDEDLRIKMMETVDSTKRVLTLECATVKIFSCANYSIEATHSVTSSKITINFIRVVMPGNICATALGPAVTRIELGSLANKTYDLELNFPGERITGTLEVSAGSFIANLPSQTKVEFTVPDLKRVPDNTIYGTVGYHSMSTIPVVDQFIDSLQYYGATPTLYLPGNYGHFRIDSNGEIEQTQNPGYYFYRYYIFQYTGNSQTLKGMVRRYGLSYPDSLLITLNTTRGETFYSWMQ